MTEVWKSNARKFCEICKVWFADNRVSIEHHENGQKHKAALNQKLRDLGKQSKEKEEAQSELQATLAKMEAAARLSMGENSGSSELSGSAIGPVPKPRSYMDPRAHGSSVAEMARELAQRKKQQQIDSASSEMSDINDNAEDKTVWVEAKTETGISYYFQMYTGATVWEKPANYFTTEQYALKLASIEGNSETLSGNNIIEPSGAKTVPRREWGHPSSSTISNISIKKFSKDATVSQSVPNAKLPKKEVIKDSNAIAEAKNFDITEHEIPLPPTIKETEIVSTIVKIEPKSEETIEMSATSSQLEVDDPIKSEPNEAPEESVDYSSVRKSKASPYGKWTRVEKTPEQPKVDWQLPSESEGRKRKPEVKVQPEDAIVFTEKTTIVTKPKAKNVQIEFKKRRTNLSIRQRNDD